MDAQTSAPVALSADTKEDIAARLLAWYRAHKRDLPWRGGSPYAVWVSEIMLQQTQVATAIPYFLRFMERFPTVEALAAAPIEEVLKYWAGLGYYARARNLHRAAQMVVEKFGGRVPDTPEEIESLPGIGRYTAGAILSMAYNLPRPLVDANVIRVLSRVFGLRGDPKSAANQAALWSLAEQLVPSEAPGDFNQALMELGALICEPADPKCERCPLLPHCVAGNSPDPSALPELPPGRATVTVTHSAALIRDEPGRVLIVQRPLHGLWGGLWEFPRVVCASGESPQEGAARAARKVAGVEVEIGARIGKVKHGVTHHRITLYGFAACLKAPDAVPTPRECAAVRWESLDVLNDYAFSSPQALLRAALLNHAAQERAGNAQTSLSFDE
ncbi:MAG TPA: A/G-specific adenine glycosylase [Chthonomonadaceae bacterium]|nr:A/G-specific adenine glycosylase [Chthonomonadaceae bacterium]